MKRIATAIVVTVLLVFGRSARAQNLIPTAELGSAKFNVYGWMHGTFKEGQSPHELDVQRFRLRPSLEDGAWRAFFEFELSHADRAGANWLQQAWIQYKVTPEWSVRGGRLFLAGAFITPPPFLLETVNYPRTLFPSFAYGVQSEAVHGPWRLIADVTGESSKSFSDDGQMDRLEVSARLERRFSGTTMLSVSGDVWDGSELFAVDGTFDIVPKLLPIRSALYGGRNGSYKFGGYLLTMLRTTSWSEIHSQVDYQSLPGPAGVIWTNGVRFWTPLNNIEATIDHESFFAGDSDRMKRDNRWLARLEFRF